MKLSKSAGDFIKADVNVSQGDKIIFLDEGVIHESTTYKNRDGSPKQNYNFKVQLEKDSSEKIMTVNKVSRDRLIDEWGEETKDWVGRMAKINITLTPQGKKMIILDPTDLLEE